MKTIIFPCLAAAMASSITFAGPTEDVKAAAKKLAEAPNYSWTSDTQNAGGGGFGSGTSSGKIEKDGFAISTRATPNGEMQTVRKGEQMVMQNQQGEWMTMQELMAQFGGGGGGARGGGQGRGAPQGGAAGGRGTGGRGGGGGFFGFGGGQNTAGEIAALVDGAKDLKVADGVISGSLTEETVTQRVFFGGRGGRGAGGGQAAAAPKNVSGSVKFWLKEGAIAKFEIHVKATVQGRDGEMDIDRTTTFEIKDVGTTKVEVPEGAKKKLGA